MYKCLYNLELLILGTAKTPFQDYDEPIRKETPANYVRQLEGTDVDAIMICPTAWKRPLWPSKVDPHWEKEAPYIQRPYFSADMKFHEKAYFRLKDYMLQGNDPVAEAVNQANRQGIAPFISYRMNDHHYLKQQDAFVHPAFWRDNPQFWLGKGASQSDGLHKWDEEENRHFDYMHEPVREYYYSLLSELVEGYDIAGLELDFMRSPVYFKTAQLPDGRKIMTQFVRRIRKLLDLWGERRGKHLMLCVRVPYSTQWCWDVGLDVSCWDKEGLIDMVNISPFFISSPKLDIAGYKKIVHKAKLYGEMHFIVDKAVLHNGYGNNVTRKTTKYIYRALAATFLDQGMDGVSFFNADYARHHYFNEPRRDHLINEGPPFDAFRGITQLESLKNQDKHYFVGPHYSELPMYNNLDIELYLADRQIQNTFKHALLRLKTKDPCVGSEVHAYINGQKLEEILWVGELFPPLSIEGIAKPECVKYYRVPVSILKYGVNHVAAKNLCDDPTVWGKQVVYETVELGLYKYNSLLDNE